MDKLSPGKTFVLTAARSFSEERTDLFFINEGTPSGLTEGRDPYPWGPFHPFILGLFFKFLGPDMNVIYFFYSGV
ncbi:MAG: hypothetical protein KAU24_00465, partial [Candidatus Aenigmarchaeota archaeon]|nr:hypothetical protein [Candidatus Aenigmarchaeota archaeon]